MTGPAAGRPRSPRQLELIAVAARLFAERGYHAVGINDISGELGLTGPAFYRHYPSKEALLVAMLDDAITAHLTEVGDLVRSSGGPLETLRAIVDNHVDFVLDHSENILTWRTEFNNLPEADRRRLRYLQRLYTDEWVRTLRELRPDLAVEQLRVVGHGAIALIQSATEFQTKLPRAQLIPILSAMALHAMLETPIPAATTMPAVDGGAERVVRPRQAS